MARRVTKLRIEAVRRDHFCSTFQPHIYGGFILNGATLWPEFDLRSCSGAGIVPQYQRDQPYSGQKYGGYLDPASGEVVGSHRTIGSKGCFLATLAMALTFVGVPITVPELQADMQANRGFIPERVCEIVSVGGQNPADTVVITGLPRAAGHAVPAWSEFVVNRTDNPYGGALARFLVLDSTRAIVLAHPGTAPPIAQEQEGYVYRNINIDEVTSRLSEANTLRLGFGFRVSGPATAAAVESALMDSLPSMLYVGPNDTIPHWVLTTGWAPAFVSEDSARGTYRISDPAQTAGPSTLMALHGNQFKGAWVARVVPPQVPQLAASSTGVGVGNIGSLEIVHTGYGHVHVEGVGGASLHFDPQSDTYVTNIPGAVAIRHAQPGNPADPGDPDVPADLFLIPVNGATTYSVTSIGTQGGTVALTGTFRPDIGSGHAAGESATLDQGERGVFSIAVDPTSAAPVAIALVTTVNARSEPRKPTLGMRISPNPTAGFFRVDYLLPNSGPMHLSLFDVAGRRVRTLRSGFAISGAHVDHWDGRDDQGRLVPAGLYFVKLKTNRDAAVGRCLRLLESDR